MYYDIFNYLEKHKAAYSTRKTYVGVFHKIWQSKTLSIAAVIVGLIAVFLLFSSPNKWHTSK